MAKKKVIICIGPDQVLMQTIAGAYLRNRAGILCQQDSFTAELDNNINRMFGLLFSPDEYADRMDVLLPDFYGSSQQQVYYDFKRLLIHYGGPGVFGRITGRRLRFVTTGPNTFVFAGLPQTRSLSVMPTDPSPNSSVYTPLTDMDIPHATLRALGSEQSVGADNMLVIYADANCELPRHDRVALEGITIKEVFPNRDKELLPLYVKGCIKPFMNIED